MSDGHRQIKQQDQKARADRSSRPGIRIAAEMVIVVSMAALGAALWAGHKNKPVPSPQSTPLQDTALSPPVETPAPQNQAVLSGDSVGAPAPELRADKSAPAPQPQPTPETRQLVQSLVSFQPEKGAMTPERAAEWKQNLQRLIQQGAAAVPAIREFLAANTDTTFDKSASQLLGYASARAAMFDALTQIGGPEAVAALAEVLQTVSAPMEIAALAQDLDKLQPEQFRPEAIDAAQQALSMAGDHKQDFPDVAPLFEVLQKYGGSAVVPELEKATAQWSYYGTIALAQLPDSAGVPSLIQLAQDPNTPSGTRDAAIQMLASVSDQSTEAAAALFQQARSNAISDFAWLTLAPLLQGDQVGLINSAFNHLDGLPQVGGLRTTSTSDNQNFFSQPADVSPTQAGQRLAMIDQLLSVTTNPTATEALQQARASIATHLLQPVASAGP